MTEKPIIIAVPKGRILQEFRPLLARAGIVPEPAFDDEASRLLRFKTNRPDIELIRVRSFDVATYVVHGAAALGVCGEDVLAEHDHADLYAPLDLKIGHCRLSLCRLSGVEPDKPRKLGHIRVATKYPHLTRRHFAAQGVQAECVELSGAMELAPIMGLASYIVDLVATGATLKANNLEECEVILQVSSYLIVNRSIYKTGMAALKALMNSFRQVNDAYTS